jgi:extracellular elastinolytic metalloproteinase
MHILDSRDPYKVAEAFLKLYRAPYPTRSFVIRKDSYTDEKTGVTHIFARQLVGAAEVADGDINLNIRDGWVLSYGNSVSVYSLSIGRADASTFKFYAGPEENSTLSVPNWHQAVYCAEPTTSLNDHACGSTLDRVQAIASLRTFDPSTCHSDPRAAVFFFLQAAHPDPTSLALNFDSFQLEPRVCTEAYEEPMWCAGWAVSGVANGLPPVIARSVLVQTPALDGTTRTRLNPAWRLEVTLPDNQYEAYVSAHDPTKIISVTDWVVDAPTPDEDGWLSTLQRHVFGHYQNVLDAQDPLNVDPKQQTAPVPSPFPSAGKYRVWKWGINDPEGGKRTLEVEPKDRTASPLGWHSFPAANDPLREHPELGTDTIVNYTTTIGNNARLSLLAFTSVYLSPNS